MKYRDNWDKSRERMIAYWNKEIIDRCCVSIYAPKTQYKSTQVNNSYLLDSPEDKFKYWTDGECIAKINRESFENTYYGLDAFPNVFLNFGAAGHAGYFKNIRHQFEKTVWFFSFMKEMKSSLIEFDPNSLFYNKTIEVAKYLANDSRGDYFISMPDIAGDMDALAHMRGTDHLLIDMIEDEDEVSKAISVIHDGWLKVNEEVYQILNSNNMGGSTIGWLHTWGPGRHSQMQSDISVMISPTTYEKLILPELEAQLDWLEYPLYHLDGIEQLRHLNLLLSIKKYFVIQWTSVAGQPSQINYIPEMKKIQAAGKGLMLHVQPSDLEIILTELSSKGLYLVVNASSPEEAKELEKIVFKYTHE